MKYLAFDQLWQVTILEYDKQACTNKLAQINGMAIKRENYRNLNKCHKYRMKYRDICHIFLFYQRNVPIEF